MLDEGFKNKTREMYRAMLPFISPEILKTKQELEKALDTGSKFQAMTRLGRLENAKAAISRGLEKDRFVFSDAEKSGLSLVDEIANQKLRAENLKQRQGESAVLAGHPYIAAETFVDVFHGERIRSMKTKTKAEQQGYQDSLISQISAEFEVSNFYRRELKDAANWDKFYLEFERRAEVSNQYL